MQILNISVTNRPSKSITSKPYVYYDLHKVSTDFKMLDVVVKTILNESWLDAAIETQFTMNDALVRDIMVSYRGKPFSIQTSFVMNDVKITKEVAYKKYNHNDLKVQTSFAMRDAVIVKEVRYLTRDLPLIIQTEFKMLDAQIL